MALSINPIDIIKTFQERGIRKRERIADYLDVLADVATVLAKTWNGIYSDYSSWGESEAPLSHLVGGQTLVFYEASEHYKRASAVLDGKLTESQMKELFDALGALLTTRNETKRLYELANEERRMNRLIFEGGDLQGDLETSITLTQMEKNVDAMNKEAAVLRALASSIRAE